MKIKIKWTIINENLIKKILNNLILKFTIRLIHIFFYITPNFRSYKIGSEKNYPKFIIG